MIQLKESHSIYSDQILEKKAINLSEPWLVFNVLKAKTTQGRHFTLPSYYLFLLLHKLKKKKKKIFRSLPLTTKMILCCRDLCCSRKQRWPRKDLHHTGWWTILISTPNISAGWYISPSRMRPHRPIRSPPSPNIAGASWLIACCPTYVCPAKAA